KTSRCICEFATENFISCDVSLVVLVMQMVLSIVERIKGFLFSPSDTFDNSREDTLGDALKYFIVLLAIYAVLLAIIAAVAFSVIVGMMGPLGAAMVPFGAGTGALAAIGAFIGAIIGGIIGIFIGGLWLHLWVYVVGGRNGFTQTIKAVTYGMTPSLLLGWIPGVNIIAAIWALIVEIIGIRQLHELSTGKAVLAVIIAIAIPVIIGIVFIVLIATFTVSMSEMMSQGPSGPGFGGY
ncbi:MAG: YIP1 family protein, partial [Euryarchaeota archaeon]|nr:YIP1 family protein [Euryarchaeota archaeon]